jgi:peptidoglycan hydrolase-like protein with peptidoglycan-binding domain
MKRAFSKLAVLFVLLTAFALISHGTASAHSATVKPQTVSPSVIVPFACPATVQEGSSGSAVRTLQSALNGLLNNFNDPSFFEMSPDTYTAPLSVDGSFGSQTLRAVIDFQTWNSPAFGGTLTVDGIIGPQSWHVLHKC